MVTIPQIFGVTRLLDFSYGATWSTNRKNLFNWKEVVSGDYEQKIKTFFERRRFLLTLRDSIIFLSKDDMLTKVILRQHQVRAVEKVVRRVDEGIKQRGLIWHTQGSGKTLTMITIASLLLRAPQGEKPTVIMIVDRNELESQLFKNIQAYGIGTVRVAASKKDVQDILDSDYRGLVVSMVHKFDRIRARSTTRKSIIVLVDEAHRSTGGSLGDYLMGALPNATYIGFTGTPIDTLSQGKGTFKVFGTDDPEGYLDTYSIAESIDDGTTVKLNYALAPSQLRVDRETDDRAVEATIHAFYDDKTRREAFLTFFRHLQNLYEVLSPDAFLRPYLEDYEALADLYAFVRRDLDLVSPDKELTRKTRALLRQHTSSSALHLPGAIRELGPRELAMLRASNVSETIKALKLRRLLTVTVEERARYEPHVIPIGERAEEVATQYEERHIATRQALEDDEKLAEQ
jgi:HsdR family type I site-specific deoxyribonuclease